MTRNLKSTNQVSVVCSDSDTSPVHCLSLNGAMSPGYGCFRYCLRNEQESFHDDDI